MGKIFYLMGKSTFGKDTLFKAILNRCPVPNGSAVYNPSHPCRGKKRERVFFSDRKKAGPVIGKLGKVIECRTYETMMGPWSYFTADDGQIDLKNGTTL